MRGWCILAVLALGVTTPAVAAKLDKVSPGYVYFHKVGAGLAAHDAAVADCAAVAAKLRAPAIDKIRGLLTGPMTRQQQRAASRVHFDATLEDCMVARRWDVVRLDDAEGTRLAALPQEQLAAALAPWVGAIEPQGEIVRKYAPIGLPKDELSGDLNAGIYDPDRPSLSFLAAVGKASRTEQSVEAAYNFYMPEGRPLQWRLLAPTIAAQGVAPDASVIVLNVKGGNRTFGDIEFVRLDDEGAPSGGLTYFAVAEPTTLFSKRGAPNKTYVFVVPPGHWRIHSAGLVSFCLGGPAFDVQPGEAVYAGTFNAALPYAFDPTFEPEKAQILGPDLAARLHPARYVNGETWDCGILNPSYAYTLELPGFPFLDQSRGEARTPKDRP